MRELKSNFVTKIISNLYDFKMTSQLPNFDFPPLDNLPSIRPLSRESPVYSRNKNLIETQEQLKVTREELSRKERLISQLLR